MSYFNEGKINRLGKQAYFHQLPDNNNVRVNIRKPVCSIFGENSADSKFNGKTLYVPGRFEIMEDAPIIKIIKEEDGFLNFSKDGVRYSKSNINSNKTKSLDKKTLESALESVKITLAIKTNTPGEFEYITSTELFNLINEDGSIEKYNDKQLDKKDVGNVLCALNEMFSRKNEIVNRFEDRKRIIKKAPLEDYYSRICVTGKVPVFYEYEINSNDDISGVRLLDKSYEQDVIFCPAWPDYSEEGLGRGVKQKEPEYYEKEIERILELQIAAINPPLTDLTITCLNDFLKGVEKEKVGNYKLSFCNAVNRVAGRYKNINFSVFNNRDFPAIKNTENIHIAKSKDGKPLDLNHINILTNRGVAKCINPSVHSGPGNGALGSKGGKAVEEGSARTSVLETVIGNASLNYYLNSQANFAGELGAKIIKYTPKNIRVENAITEKSKFLEQQLKIKRDKEINKRKQQKNQQQNNNKQNQPPIKQPPLEILTPKQINGFDVYYKNLKSRSVLHLAKVNKTLQFEERIKTEKARFRDMANYMKTEGNKQEQNDDKKTTKPMIKAFLLNGEISDGKLTQMIVDACKYGEILFKNKELCETVRKPNVPFSYEIDGAENDVKSYNGFGIQFEVYSDRMQVNLLDNEFFSDHLDGNSRQILNGLRIDFNDRFDINNPRDANMLIMVKTNPHFVLNHLHELGCIFRDSGGNELPKEQVETMLKGVARVTELKKQIDKLNKIREEAISNPITEEKKFKKTICDVLIVCSTDEETRDKFLGKDVDINDINTYYLSIVKNPERVFKFDNTNTRYLPYKDITDLNDCRQFFSTLLSIPEYKNNLSEVFKLELKQVSENLQKSLQKTSSKTP